jgi:small subunit ribosomal protein S16
LSVKIRLKKTGRRNVNSFRIVVTDIRASRDGDIIERVGTYLPEFPQEAKQLVVDAERVKHWLSMGALPTGTVVSLLKRAGIETPKQTAQKKRSSAAK